MEQSTEIKTRYAAPAHHDLLSGDEENSIAPRARSSSSCGVFSRGDDDELWATWRLDNGADRRSVESTNQWDISPQALSSRWSLQRISAVAIAVIAALAVVIAWWMWRPVNPESLEPELGAVAASAREPDSIITSTSTASAANTEVLDNSADTSIAEVNVGASGQTSAADQYESSSASTVAVHVVGQVKNPGVFYLSNRARLADAIEAAGGMTKKADQSALNLAQFVADGQQIYVPKLGEISHNAQQPSNAVTGDSSSSTSAAAQSATVININTADAAQLEQLPGIGPSLAEQIMTWRQTSGGCTNPEQLLEVPGIGSARYAAIADLVTC